MPRLLVFQHVAAEPLGTLDRLIRRRGHRIRFANFERQPDFEPNVDRYRGLIVLGGPMNVEDQARRPHLKTELRAIEHMDRALALAKEPVDQETADETRGTGDEVAHCPFSDLGWPPRGACRLRCQRARPVTIPLRIDHREGA